MVYLEAMCLGKPVVGYNNGGVPEVVENQVTGLLTDPYNIPALAQSLRTLALDPELRKTLGTAGREWVLRESTPEKMCAQMEIVYHAILTGRRETESVPAVKLEAQ